MSILPLLLVDEALLEADDGEGNVMKSSLFGMSIFIVVVWDWDLPVCTASCVVCDHDESDLVTPCFEM